MAERLDRDLETKLARETAVEDRQVVLLLWFFEQYRRLGPHQIIRYEDVISSNAGILPAVFGIPHRLNHTLETRNRAHFGGTSYRPLAEKLIAQGGAYMDHYSAQEILSLASPSN